MLSFTQFPPTKSLVCARKAPECTQMRTDFSKMFMTSNLTSHAGQGNKLQHSTTQGCLDREHIVLSLPYDFLLLLYFNLKTLESTKVGKQLLLTLI